MTHSKSTSSRPSTSRACFAILGMACAGLAPARAGAQVHPKVAPLAQIDSLGAQEKEMLAIANDFAKRCVAAMERWIANKETTEEKLFGFLYYPIPDTDPPMYRTDWDVLADRDIQPLGDSVLAKSSAIVFAIITDKNGYIPAHNQRYSLPLTGNKAMDLVNNRTKKIVVHKTALRAQRNEAPFLFQRYPRETGEMMVDLSVPLNIRGVHWGTVRVGYRQTEN
ncbi:MAG: hypothetical protein A2V77_11555 [Anaeromyxobacter sp. RBG_16_69_14]|nr:MAG: hypothetical protein A2V77_11555 [Anaeromyxobacter sp. RBG_16_69_14]